jgi:3-deoxy-D-manno-octulosonic-acid transferase
MPALLNFVYAALLVAAFPFLLYRRVRQGKYRAGWREKLLGELPELVATEERIWFHAVSVGEVILLKGLVAELRSRRPDVEVVLTTTTETGFEVARKQFPDLVVCFFPLDFTWAVRRALRRIKPTAIVLAELELWPNLILAASGAGVRLAIVNGRLSEKSFRGYRKLRPLVASLLRRFDSIAVQSEEYAGRFVALGAARERVTVTGSVKFDGACADRSNAKTAELRRAFGVRDHEIVFIAGSTQYPEEEYALATWRELVTEFSTLRLILVPRHKERFEEVARLVEREGVPLVRRSQTNVERGTRNAEHRFQGDRAVCVAPSSEFRVPSSAVLLLDTLGELGACWGLADVAFVGGSLTSRGGQNMIEPAAYGAAVLFGPDTRNFRDAVNLLLAAEGARVVGDGAELTRAVRELVGNAGIRTEMGSRARAAVAAHRGATDRTVGLLLSLILPAREASRRNAA